MKAHLKTQSSVALALITLSTCMVWACSSDGGDGYSTLAPGTDADSNSTDSGSAVSGVSGVGGATTSTATTAPPVTNSTTGINLSSGTDSGTTGPVNVGQEDLCDGVDNDGNGIIDDVDVGHDGICDCLRIATLGIPGTWGEGDVFDAWLNSRSNNGAVALADAVLTAEVLAPYQVIVAQDLSTMERSYAPEEVEALSAWINAGGGFMTLIGYADPDEILNVNSLLAPFGLSYGTEQILPRGRGPTVPVTGWVSHPVTQGITQIGVDLGYPVQGGTVIATEQGYDLLTAVEASMGHVLVWGDEWITYNSEWTEHPEYQVELFWVNAIKWLTPANDCQVPIPEQIK